MPRTWLQIRVDLLGGGGIDCDPSPGRILIVGPSHSFEVFAEAIDAAFARWDLSHLHSFDLADGRLIGFPDDEFEPDVVSLDHGKLKVAREVKPGDEFEYVFDLGDNWRHRCTVASEKADPLEVYGIVPDRPVAIDGWGSIPDQYGRVSFEGNEPEWQGQPEAGSDAVSQRNRPTSAAAPPRADGPSAATLDLAAPPHATTAPPHHAPPPTRRLKPARSLVHGKPQQRTRPRHRQ